MIRQYLRIIPFVVLTTTGWVNYANAESYIGGNVVLLEYSEDGVPSDASLKAVGGRIGGFFNEYLSGEFRFGFGIGDDTVTVSGIDVDVELKDYFGAYLRGGIPTGTAFYPYALVGFTRGELEASAFGVSVSDSESDLTIGVGADIEISDGLVINAEYANYLDKDGFEVTGFSLGIAKAF